ncbi:BTAD domain-containing putative transcriptional regulator [Streptomyces sp. NPDC001817]|uniref:BTAD domain-containing putative transcriptional regulator n=1 Tax=Streptomyces sp. NPDC001817 TaxID=3154398 RepID=UPI003327E7CF
MLFTILGPMEARTAEGEPLELGGARLRLVLALLLEDVGKVVSTERLIDEVYGDEPPASAANALQSQISRLRRRLGVTIESLPHGYRLDVDPDAIDAHRFERLARQGHEALSQGDHRRAAALLREALGLWRGPAQTQAAARLEELRLAAQEDRIEADLVLGESDALVPELRQLVETYPLRERLSGLLMRALHASGRRAEALTVYEHTRTTLVEELGTDPSAELSRIHQELLRSDGAPGGITPRGVPAQFTSFVGRDQELRRIRELVASARLVTLIGPGGVGKTRLAVEAASSERADDVCFVELAPLEDGGQVHAAVLTALGLRPGADGGRGPEERLVTALAERRLLLVLDNCEHVVEDTARLARRLLGACPGVRILCTGREALGLTGEALCPLSPLERRSAVQLFTDRAVAVSPGFTADAARAGVVEWICTALDGMPLALELAAARLRTLNVEDIAARLDDRFKLLSRGDRTADPRHRTLRSVVEWSWDLLDADERAMARRLTVFAGGATFAAAEAVCHLPDTEQLLDSLVGKSLAELREGRVTMFETVRAFCAERLVESGEQEEFRRAHAAYFLDLAQRAEPCLRRTEQVEWLAVLGAEQGNLEAALRWTMTADPEAALRLVAELTWYWWLRGLTVEHATLATTLLTGIGERPPPGLDEEYALCALNAHTEWALERGADRAGPDGQQWLDRADAVLLGIDRPLRRPILTVLRALIAGPGRAADEATRRRQIGADPWSRAVGLMGDGFQPWFGGQPEEAEAQFVTALAHFRQTGDRWGMANCLDPLAMFADWRGDHEQALAHLDEAMVLVGQLDAPEEMAGLLCHRADALLHCGDFEQAAADYGRAAELARRVGSSDKVAAAQLGLGDVARLRGDTAGAREWYQRGLASCGDHWFSGSQIQRLHTGLGRVAEAEQRPEEARTWHVRALRTALELHTPADLAQAAEGLAGLAVLEGAGERAALLLGAGVALRGMAVAGDPDVTRTSRSARALAGADLYTMEYDRGRAVTLQAAVQLLTDTQTREPVPGAPES